MEAAAKRLQVAQVIRAPALSKRADVIALQASWPPALSAAPAGTAENLPADCSLAPAIHLPFHLWIPPIALCDRVSALAILLPVFVATLIAQIISAIRIVVRRIKIATCLAIAVPNRVPIEGWSLTYSRRVSMRQRSPFVRMGQECPIYRMLVQRIFFSIHQDFPFCLV